MLEQFFFPIGEVRNAVNEVEHGESECRCGVRHPKLGLPRVWRKNGGTRQRVQVSGRMSDRLASDLGSSQSIQARSRLVVACSLDRSARS